MPESHFENHPSAQEHPDTISQFIETELAKGGIAGPFTRNPLISDLTISPLMTVPKRGTSKRRVVHDLSFPPGRSVNSGIDNDLFLGQSYTLRLPGVDRLIDIIRLKGPGCLLFKLDLSRAYRQIPVDPLDYRLLGFSVHKLLYFHTCLVFGQRSAVLACQRTTKGAIFAFEKMGYTADVYIDDFFGADTPELAYIAFVVLKTLLAELGLQMADDKEVSPSTTMLCLGIIFDTIAMTVSVPDFRMAELKDILNQWLTGSYFTKHILQSLLGKLSYVAACVKPGRIFMSRLLNILRDLPGHGRGKFRITDEIRADLRWWDTFLPLYNGVSIIKEGTWVPADSFFFTDACLFGFGAVCDNEFIHGEWTEGILSRIENKELHISALELYTIVIAVKTWASKLYELCVLIACDNEAATIAINSGKSRDPFMQQCLRELWLISAVNEFEIRAVHIPGRDNTLADWLSRWLDATCRAKFECYNNSLPEPMQCKSFDYSVFEFSCV